MKVWQLLNAPEKWCQRVEAMDFKGMPVNALASDAVCWCLGAALEKCYYDVLSVSQPKLFRAREKVIGALGRGSIISWNDEVNRTFEEVRQLVRSLDI